MPAFTGKALDFLTPIAGLPPRTPSTSTPDYVSLKGYDRMLAVIIVDNGSTVTGSAITLKQATAVAGTSEKELAFASAYRNIDTDAASALASFTVSSNTFTTDSTNAKNLLYVIDVPVSSLDTANGFDCVRVGTGDGANMVLSVMYFLYSAKYSGQVIDAIGN